ncbi:MAG: phosphoribosylformylglycinamidine synthase subunit PurQ [Deltaproteobacteria bacterium]|nr:phosphoribosylformylglycinamidine synthase subunit PurQ [Deltaproteobacteria bacterium]
MTHVLVLEGLGFNCEDETAAAYRLAGGTVEVRHARELLRAPRILGSFGLLHIPGGFSFGDELGSGRAFANRLRHPEVFAEVVAFQARGGLIVGVCNGFQILVRTGLVPNLGGNHVQEVALAQNLSGRFEDRWVRCRTDGRLRSSMGQRVLELPVRHGEGRLVFRDDAVKGECEARGLIGLRYADQAGRPTQEFPGNPNGAALATAALESADGRAFGLMPHPEAFLDLRNLPSWGQRLASGRARPTDEPDGLALTRMLILRARAPNTGAIEPQRSNAPQSTVATPSRPGGDS